jgi:hypothetical protein
MPANRWPPGVFVHQDSPLIFPLVDLPPEDPKTPVLMPAEALTPSSALQFLECARRIQAQRADDYDQPDGERSMQKVVALFNLLTGHELKESDGWLLQQILKMVRDQSRVRPHLDSLMDNIGYGSLYAEARMDGR